MPLDMGNGSLEDRIRRELPHLTEGDVGSLTRIVERLSDAYQPQRIFLFGSVARGEAGPDSDYDLLIVVPDDVPPDRQDSDLAYRALRGTGIAADVIVWKRSAFERRKHVVTLLPATVLREGRLL